MAANDHDVFADQLVNVFCARASGGQSALHFFAVHFDNKSFAFFVERLEFAGVGDGFAAASLAGNDGEAEQGEGAEDGFHR